MASFVPDDVHIFKSFVNFNLKIICPWFYDGGMYSPAKLVCIRAAIHRYLTLAEVNKKINILKDDDF